MRDTPTDVQTPLKILEDNCLKFIPIPVFTQNVSTPTRKQQYFIITTIPSMEKVENAEPAEENGSKKLEKRPGIFSRPFPLSLKFPSILHGNIINAKTHLQADKSIIY